MTDRRKPRIVAELGRPETPEETAQRKAASSKRYRESKTALNLAIALVASLAIVFALVLIAVRPDPPDREPVDFASIARSAEDTLGATPVAPRLPQGWTANAARLSTGADGITTWYIGFLTADGRFIGVTQAVDANATWLVSQLPRPQATGGLSIAGTEWAEYDRRAADPTGMHAYALSTTIDESTLVLYGTADDDEFTRLAELIVASLKES